VLKFEKKSERLVVFIYQWRKNSFDVQAENLTGPAKLQMFVISDLGKNNSNTPPDSYFHEIDDSIM